MSKFVILVYDPIDTPKIGKKGVPYLSVTDDYRVYGPFASIVEAEQWMEWRQGLGEQFDAGDGSPPMIRELHKPERLYVRKFKSVDVI